ncbi:MAG: dicarboxylate/amino acid:cation symporter [Gemmatimonadetes bacterium]|nr:dicarboxylate/amino acid:cation symporter [Gemmatimonadota bacterium]
MTLRINTRALTTGSLLGLALGLTAGIVAFETRNDVLLRTAAAFGPVGELWVNALRMIVMPLIVSHIIVAIAGGSGGPKAGRIGGLSFVSFIALLALAAAFTLLVATPFIRSFDIDAGTRANFLSSAGMAAQQSTGPVEQAGTFAEWLLGIVPANPLQAAVEGQILPVLVVTVIFALALTRIGAEPRATMIRFFEAIVDATHVIIGWILAVLPIGVFAIAFSLTAGTGFDTAGILGFFVVLTSFLLIAFTVLLYPLTALLGRIPLGRFARGVAPSQVVALGTRSSLASLPALMEGADRRLGLPASVSAFVLPLAVSTFKVNRTISSPIKLLFLAHVYGIVLDPATVALFIPTVMILSFSSPGIPSGGFLVTLPFYMAAGIPVQGIILLNAVDAIPDIFKTLVNVTADMSVATVVTRFAGVTATSPAVAGAGAIHEPAGPALGTASVTTP